MSNITASVGETKIDVTVSGGVGPSGYELPTASDSVLGGVKIGAGISIDGNGVISADSGGGSYTLPVATDAVLGGVKIGSGVTITDGVISVSTAYASISHTHAAADITSGTLAIDRIPTGTTSATVCIGDDARLADARTPTGHKATHATGGSDALTASDIGAAAASHAHGISDVTGLQTSLDAKLDRTFADASLAYAATVNLDMAALAGLYRTLTLTGNVTFTTSNLAAGRAVVIRLLPGASARTLAFPADWVFLGAVPTTLAGDKTAVLSVTFFGAADTDAVVAYAVQP